MLDLGIYLSAFQPFTKGDAEALGHVAAQSHRVLILIGSSNRPRSIRAPFTYQERRAMIEGYLPGAIDPSRVTILDLPDFPGDDTAWAQRLVASSDVVLRGLGKGNGSVGIACMQGRGALSNIIPREWAWIDTHSAPVMSDPSIIRDNFVAGGHAYRTACPLLIAQNIEHLTYSDWYKELVADAKAASDLRAKYGPGPFQAVDVIVQKGSRVLTIRRGNRPNRGALAFPGGIIDPGETALEAARREVGEETSIGSLFGLPVGVPVPFDPVTSRRYDDPRRDPRYHMTTEAFLWVLPDDGPDPHITGHDDAADYVHWLEIGSLTPEIMWADHGFILRDLARPS